MGLNTFAIYAKNPEKAKDLQYQAEQYGFKHFQEAPDFVISMGGDGTFLIAERDTPGIPKLLVRDSIICYKCQDKPIDDMLKAIQSGNSRIREIVKIEASHPNGQLVSVNDVILRNKNPTQAIRFSVEVNGEEIDDMVIGDGIVAATPFGATGYYRSITRKTFDHGIGVAFNNSTQLKPPLVLNKQSEVMITMIRGVGQLACDNSPNIEYVEEGDRITIRESEQIARLITHL